MTTRDDPAVTMRHGRERENVTTDAEREATVLGTVGTDAAREAARRAVAGIADEAAGDGDDDAGTDVVEDAVGAARAARGLRRRAKAKPKPDGTDGEGDGQTPTAQGQAAADDATDTADATDAIDATDVEDTDGAVESRVARPHGHDATTRAMGDAMPSPTRDMRAGDSPRGVPSQRGPSTARTNTDATPIADGTVHAEAFTGPRPATNDMSSTAAPRPGGTRTPVDTSAYGRAATAPLPVRGTIATTGTDARGTGAWRRARRRVPTLTTATITGPARPMVPVATASAAAGSNAAMPATAAVAVPIAVCALALWATFMVLMSILVGGAADEDRIAGARRVADVATEAYETGANRGDYHWKGQAFRDYVGGTTGAWDAAFCSWCLGQAGFVDSGLVGRYASVGSFVARFQYGDGVGEVHGPDDTGYVPEVGDLLVLRSGTGAVRIEVVTGISGDGQTVTTVSGDAAGGEAGSYDRDADGLGGYVAVTERPTRAADATYLHPSYSAEPATATQ